jgi:hypothetical protein
MEYIIVFIPAQDIALFCQEVFRNELQERNFCYDVITALEFDIPVTKYLRKDYIGALKYLAKGELHPLLLLHFASLVNK